MTYLGQLGYRGLYLGTLRSGLDPWWLLLEGVCNLKGKIWISFFICTSLTQKLWRGRVAHATASCATRLDWQVATKVVTYGRAVWAIDSFAPHKSPGMDGIFPALLQEGREVLVPSLVRIFRACLAIGYVPAMWHQVKVVFIPKPSRDSYGWPKEYRPISLTSFLPKTMERLIDF
jgi:hypothetical protein